MDIRERILVKAQELFNRYGFKRVTMDDIAVKTGMSKKTIYQSFTNKDEIVSAVVDDYINRSLTVCEGNCLCRENAVHEIFLNIEMVQDLMSELHPSVIEDLEKYFPAVFIKVYQHKNNYIYKKVKENLERGISEGFFRQELNVEIISRLRIATMFIPFDPSVFPPNKYSFADVEREILEHYLFGLCTEEGKELIKKYKKRTIK